MNWAKYLWSNGHKGTVAALAYLLAATMFLCGALVMSYCFATQDGFDPVYFPSGLVIQTPVSMSSLGLDAGFVVCSKEDKEFTASVSTKWIQHLSGTDNAVHLVLGRDFNAVVDPGCTDIIFTDAPIPVGVSAAKPTSWSYMVTYTIERGTRAQVVSLTSPAFEVVP